MCKSCRTCFMFYCMFYFTCDRSLKKTVNSDESKTAINTVISIIIIIRIIVIISSSSSSLFLTRIDINKTHARLLLTVESVPVFSNTGLSADIHKFPLFQLMQTGKLFGGDNKCATIHYIHVKLPRIHFQARVPLSDWEGDRRPGGR